MKVRCKSLRPYQARLVTDVCRARGDVLVEQPTGSGKSMQIVTLVGMQVRLGIQGFQVAGERSVQVGAARAGDGRGGTP